VAYPEFCNDEGILCPGVIVAHAIGGITHNERWYALELARRGYVAFASDVYGNDPNVGVTIRSDVPLHRGRLLANVELMLTVPALQGVVDISKIGAQGYCFGGNSVMEMARGNPNLVESAGGALRAVQTYSVRSPLFDDMDGFINPSIRFQLHHAGSDDFNERFGSFESTVDDLRNQTVEVWHALKYGTAPHGFMFPTSASYTPSAVEPALESSYKFYEQAFAAVATNSVEDPRVHNDRANGEYNPLADLAAAATNDVDLYHQEGIVSFDLPFTYEDVANGQWHRGGGKFEYTAFVAHPEGAKNAPAVIVAHAFGGVTASEKYYAVELARQGYVAFALDVFGDDPKPEDLRADVPLRRGRLQANVKLMLTTPALQGIVDSSRIGAQGYCFGGASVMELARGNPNPVEAAGGVLGAVQPYHGSPYSWRNSSTLDDFIRPSIRFQIHHSGPDDFVEGRADYDIVVEELRTQQVEIWHAFKYGEAEHGFMSVGGSSYTPTTVEPALLASYKFYDMSIGPPQPPQIGDNHGSDGITLSDGAIVGISIGSLAAVGLIAGMYAYFKPNPAKGKEKDSNTPLININYLQYISSNINKQN
jgi:dienelactone hydrolase